MKFANEGSRKSAQGVLREGAKGEFWRLITEALTESKADITKKQRNPDMKELPASQYKLQNEIFEAKKEFIDKLLSSPADIVSWLDEPDNMERSFDPY